MTEIWVCTNCNGESCHVCECNCAYCLGWTKTRDQHCVFYIWGTNVYSPKANR